MEKRRQPGYYPGFSTLEQAPYWDEATRDLVLARVQKVPPLRFFADPAEQRLAQAVVDRLLPQDDRPPDRRIPVLNYIDERLFTGRSDGYRFDGMPEDPVACRRALAAIDAMAGELHGRPFADLSVNQQDTILLSLRDEKPIAAHEHWRTLPVGHAWKLLLQDAVGAYYAHPYAWDEIGFGGPAYPRGYLRLEKGLAEPWEVEEQRYAWRAPEGSLSDACRPNERYFTGGHTGQGGSH